jgi:hypothetical protein
MISLNDEQQKKHPQTKTPGSQGISYEPEEPKYLTRHCAKQKEEIKNSKSASTDSTEIENFVLRDACLSP